MMITFCLTLIAAVLPVGGDTHDFGEVLAGVPVKHVFVLENAGAEPIEIIETRTTDRLTLDSSPPFILPGGKGEFAVTLDTGPFFGRMLRGLRVRFIDNGREGEALFKITGVVRHPVEIVQDEERGVGSGWMGEVIVNALRFQFNGTIPPGIRILSVEAAGEPPLPVKHRVESGPDGLPARLLLDLDSKGLAAGTYGQLINIRTTHPEVPLAQVPVRWDVRDPIQVLPGEIVFHGPGIFRGVEVQYPCMGYGDEGLDRPLPEPLGGRGFHLLEAKGNRARISNGQVTAWVAGSCLKPVPPAQSGQTRLVMVTDLKQRPMRLISAQCAHPSVSAFWRKLSPSSYEVGLRLTEAPEAGATVPLVLETDMPGYERIEVPVRLVAE